MFSDPNLRKASLGCPPDVRAIAAVELAATAIGDSVEALDGMNDLGEVCQQQIVSVELGLNRLEHVHRVALVRPDQTDEVAMAIEHGPNAGALADRRLAAAARHRHREQATMQNSLFDTGDDLQVVGRPRQMECLRKVRIAELAKVSRRESAPIGVRHGGQVADVAARQR